MEPLEWAAILALGAALFTSSSCTQEKPLSKPTENNKPQEPTTTITADSYHEYSVQGDLQTLIAGSGGCYGIFNHPGTAAVPEANIPASPASSQACFIPNTATDSLNTNTPLTCFDLPQAAQRSYGWSQLGSGNIASIYGSTAGFAGQDGSQQGVAVLNQANGQVTDYNLFTSNELTHPTSLTWQGGKLLVLTNNATIMAVNNQVQGSGVFPTSSLVVINDPSSGDTSSNNITVSNLPWAHDASALWVQGATVYIAAATAPEGDITRQGVIGSGTLDSNGNYQLGNQVPLASGHGLNGSVAVSNNMVLLTGANKTVGPFTLFDSTSESTLNLNTNNLMQNPDLLSLAIFGGDFYGDSLITSSHSYSTGSTQHYVWDTTSGNLAELEGVLTLSSNGSIAPIKYDTNNDFCSGETGVIPPSGAMAGPDGKIPTYSQVSFIHVTSN